MILYKNNDNNKKGVCGNHMQKRRGKNSKYRGIKVQYMYMLITDVRMSRLAHAGTAKMGGVCRTGMQVKIQVFHISPSKKGVFMVTPPTWISINQIA